MKTHEDIFGKGSKKMFAKLAAVLAVVGAFSLATDACAVGTMSLAHVITIRVDDTGLGIVTFDQTISGSPGCMSGWATSMSFDTRTSGGKALLASLYAARLVGTTVDVYGKATCNNVATVEDLGTAIVH